MHCLGLLWYLLLTGKIVRMHYERKTHKRCYMVFLEEKKFVSCYFGIAGINIFPFAVKHGPCLLIPKKGIQASKTKCMKKLFYIFYLEHKTNDRVQSKINFLVGPQEPRLASIKRRKLAWFRTCHASRQPLQNHPSGHS